MRRWLQLGAVGLLVVSFLSSCDQRATAPRARITRSPSNSTAGTAKAATVEITRIWTLNPSAQPLQRTINGQLARQLYSDIESMPPKPAGTFFCPFDNGLTYRLNFQGFARQGLTAEAHANGCRVIDLSTGRESWSLSPPGEKFWSLLRHVLGLTDLELRGISKGLLPRKRP
jgi:hypothetical protein